MKTRYWWGSRIIALLLPLVLVLCTMPVLGQIECIDDCLVALVECTNRNGESQECEDNYDACVEDCLRIQ